MADARLIRRSALALAAFAVVTGALLPAAAAPVFPELEYGLLVLGACAVLGAAAVVARRSAPDQGDAVDLARAAALWSGCLVTLAAALAAVATHAQTLEFRNLVAAQQNTHLYALQQPMAATLFVLAVALSGEPTALSAALGGPSRMRRAALATFLLGVGGLGATVFLGGYAGAWLPGPVWLVAKALFVAALIAAAARKLSRLDFERQVALAWLLALVAALNYVVTLMVLTA